MNRHPGPAPLQHAAGRYRPASLSEDGLVVAVVVAVTTATLAGCAWCYAAHADQFWKARVERPSRGLLAFRAVGAAACFGVLCAMLAEEAAASTDGVSEVLRNKFLLYFTVWNWTLIGAAFTVGAARAADARRSEEWAWLHTAMLEVCVPLAPFISTLTWGLLYPVALSKGKGALFANPYSYCMHIGNTVLCLAEYGLSRPDFRPSHVVFVLGFSMLYLLTETLLQLGGSRAPYFFLDVRRAATAAWVPGLVAGGAGLYLGWAKLSARWGGGPPAAPAQALVP